MRGGLAASRAGRSRSCRSRRRRPDGRAARRCRCRSRGTSRLRMFARWPGCSSRRAPIARGVESRPEPQAMFSPTVQLLRAAQVAGAADAVEEARPVRASRARRSAGAPWRASGRAAASRGAGSAAAGAGRGARARRSAGRAWRGRACACSPSRRRRSPTLQAPAAEAVGAAHESERERESERDGRPAKLHPLLHSTPHVGALGARRARPGRLFDPFWGRGAGRPRGCLRRPSSTSTARSSTPTTTTPSRGTARSASTTIVLPIWRIHRHIGMGGDQLVGALCGDAVEEEKGDDIRAAEKVLYSELIERGRAARGRARADRGPQGARPRGRARQLGEGGRGRPLPRPARRARPRRRLDHLGRRGVHEAGARPREGRDGEGGQRRGGDGRRHHLGRARPRSAPASSPWPC